MATSAATPTAPVKGFAGLDWALSPAAIDAECKALQKRQTEVLDAVAAAAASGKITFDTIIAPLMALDAELEARSASATFVKDVSSSEAVRTAAAAAQAELSAYEVKASMRLDVYEAVQRYADAAAADGSLAALPAERKRFVEKTLQDYKRRGLALPAPQRKLVEAIKTRASAISVAYQQRLGEWAETLAFTREELAGLPDDFLAQLEPADAEAAGAEAEAGKKLKVTLGYPHVFPILKACTVPATRAAVEKAFNSRGGEANVKALEELVTLRRWAAHVLGYPSHAAYQLEDKMAKSAETVADFLSGLQRDLLPLHEADLASLNALKAATEGAAAGPLAMSDRQFYMERELEQRFSVDHDALKAYFPFEGVKERMLALYQQLLCLRFEALPTRPVAPPAADGEAPTAEATTASASGAVPVWHEEVQCYAVFDASGPAALPSAADRDAGVAVGWREAGVASEGELLGYFYLDVHPRKGKYGHAAVFPLVSGCDTAAGRQVPVAAMVCNFPKASPEGTPALLRHDDVVTFFHEFGHVMHHICSRTQLHRFASFRCEQDFVEAPSQMLENFCWTPQTLPRVSPGHWKDGAPIPGDMLAKLAASRIAHAGLFNTRQVFLATFDQRLHTLPAVAPPAEWIAAAEKAAAAPADSEGGAAVPADLPIPIAADVDSGALLRQLHDTVLKIPHTPGTHFGASFGHLAGGYDAQYFGYLWSDVYAQDMFDTAFGPDPLSAAAGWRYRNAILSPGGARDALDSVVAFLGRQPSNAAFLRAKGLTPKE